MSKVYQMITDTIIERISTIIETGEKTGQWEKPFAGGKCVNVASKKSYRGINQFLLSLSGHSNIWGTFKQWSDKGATIKKGEKHTKVVFFKTGTYENDEGDEKSYPILRYYRVFASSQVEGYDAPATVRENDFSPIENAERYVANLGLDIRHVSNGKAFYVPSQDYVSVPPASEFLKTSTSTQTENYYSTLLHECTHATGHKSRCDRDFKGFFGDRDYAFEELVAETGAALLCGRLEITDTIREDHIIYLRGWLKAMRDNPKAIFKACSLAQKAVDWCDDQQSDEVAKAA